MASPIIETSVEEKESMTFAQAMEAVIDGHAITKLEWKNKEIFCLLKSGILTIHNEKGFHSWIINDGDMTGNDWIIKS